MPISTTNQRSNHLAKTPRTWTGARNPSGLKRVRVARRRQAILQPRRSAAKTLVTKALAIAHNPVEGIDPAVALADALSALDRAAKVGAIHPNAAARRKSRLARNMNAALGGLPTKTGTRVTKTTGKAAAQKAARTRIAAAKADKAKGAQTSAGKARAALSKTARSESAGAAAKPAEAAPTARPKAAAKAAAKTPARSKAGTKTDATKASGPRTTAAKPAAAKSAAKTEKKSGS